MVYLKHGKLLWLHGGCAGHKVDTIVHNPKHLLGTVVPGGKLCQKKKLLVVMMIIFYSLYCGILIDIDDIVVCWRTLKTKEFKSLGRGFEFKENMIKMALPVRSGLAHQALLELQWR